MHVGDMQTVSVAITFTCVETKVKDGIEIKVSTEHTLKRSFKYLCNDRSMVDGKTVVSLNKKPEELLTLEYLQPDGQTKTPIDISNITETMDRILETILGADTNVMYFCTAGKDRTGVVSALLLKRLGVEEGVIVEDYMKSKENLMEMLVSYVNAHPEVDLDIIVPREENILKVLELQEV